LTCGGANLVSVYTNFQHAPAIEMMVGDWTFEACHLDNVNGTRALSDRFDIPGGATIESCTSQCQAAGLTIAGLEFGQ